MMDRGRVRDDGVEAAVVISGVLHGAHGAIGLQETVLAMYDVTVSDLVLRLVIAGVRVSHGVGELVFWVGLEL